MTMNISPESEMTGRLLRKRNKPKFLNAGLAVEEYLRRINYEHLTMTEIGRKYGFNRSQMEKIINAYYGNSSKPVAISFSLETNKTQYERAVEKENSKMYLEAAAELIRLHPEFNDSYYLANPQTNRLP